MADTDTQTGTVTKGLLVRIEANPGREADVEAFLNGGLELVLDEPATTAWFAIQLGPSTYGIFDVFPDEGGRDAHPPQRQGRGGADGERRRALRSADAGAARRTGLQAAGLTLNGGRR